MLQLRKAVSAIVSETEMSIRQEGQVGIILTLTGTSLDELRSISYSSSFVPEPSRTVVDGRVQGRRIHLEATINHETKEEKRGWGNIYSWEEYTITIPSGMITFHDFSGFVGNTKLAESDVMHLWEHYWMVALEQATRAEIAEQHRRAVAQQRREVKKRRKKALEAQESKQATDVLLKLLR